MAKWITCKSCGHEYSSKLGRCPECSRRTPLQLRHIFAIAGAAVVCIAAVAGFVLGLQDKPEVGTVSARVKGFESSDESKTSKPEPQVSVGESDSSFNSSSSKVNTSSKAKISSQNTSKTESKSQTSESSIVIPPVDIADIVNPPKPPEKEIEVTVDAVELTIDKWILDVAGIEYDGSGPNEEDKAYGVMNILQNPDGSLTFTIEKSWYNRFTEELGQLYHDIIEQANTQPDFHYIKLIECSENLDKINIYLESDIYDYDLTASLISSSASTAIYYQSFLLDSVFHCEVNVIDFNSKETIETIVFPDAWLTTD